MVISEIFALKTKSNSADYIGNLRAFLKKLDDTRRYISQLAHQTPDRKESAKLFDMSQQLELLTNRPPREFFEYILLHTEPYLINLNKKDHLHLPKIDNTAYTMLLSLRRMAKTLVGITESKRPRRATRLTESARRAIFQTFSKL